jgi:hypothetical protein
MNTNVRDNLNYLYGAVLEGVIPATGTTPTAGTGFTYTHTNGTGVYVFTFSVAFSAVPAVVVTINAAMGTLVFPSTSSVGTTGFTVNTYNNGGAGTDAAFHFLTCLAK